MGRYSTSHCCVGNGEGFTLYHTSPTGTRGGPDKIGRCPPSLRPGETAEERRRARSRSLPGRAEGGIGGRITSRSNPTTVQWTPVDHAMGQPTPGQKPLQRAAPGARPAVPTRNQLVAHDRKLSHVTSRATEARSQTIRDCIAEHARPGRRRRPPRANNGRAGAATGEERRRKPHC